MVFSSSVFLLVFLPAVFLLNLAVGKRGSNWLLLLASLLFYAWGEPRLVVLILASIVFNWAVGLWIGNSKHPGSVLALGVACNLGVLGYYKYSGFLVSILNTLARSTIPVPKIALPIGISFFTFQAISYIADVYRGDTQASKKLSNVALYISFFPQLIAGPIVKYKDIDLQIQDRTITDPKVSAGFKRFAYGLGKKVLISNLLGLCADRVFGDISTVNGAAAWIGALAYTFQIYYDFSGYSDMAIGLGKMFGFDIPENFNYPYLSRSVSEFWRRWHMSLGSWFREYVYIPLGGSRKGTGRTCFNLFLVFLLTGIWHGAGFTFLLWGLYHGFFTILERLWLGKKLKKAPALATLYCFLVVVFGWVLFRAADVGSAVSMLARMLTPWRYAHIHTDLRFVTAKALFVALCGLVGCGWLQRIVPAGIKESWQDSILEALWCIAVLLLSIASIASDTYNPFIYFQF